MGLFDGIVRKFTGDVNTQTQQVTWSDDVVKYTSNFMLSATKFVEREFSKLHIDHRIYRLENDKYLVSDKYGSDVYETLNYSPNGFRNNSEWKREIIRRLFSTSAVYLKPIRKHGELISLEFTDAETYNKHSADIICFTSPFYISDNASLYDNILTNISRSFDQNKLRGFVKINAAAGTMTDDFVKKATAELQSLQQLAKYNGLTVIDGRSEIVELNKDYDTVDPETVNLIKREILNGFGFSESLLLGNYTNEEYKHFYTNVMQPLVTEIETELTFKLLSTNARVNNGVKQSFERITVSTDTFAFASVSELISLASANTNGAYLTVNEVRQIMGFDPIAGGDVFRTNLNSTEIKYDKNKGDSEK